MKRNKSLMSDIHLADLWTGSTDAMDMAEKVMQDLMNDPNVSPNERTFVLSSKDTVSSESRRRAERMYFWLCKMRDLRIKPPPHCQTFRLHEHLTSLALTNLSDKWNAL